MRGEEAGHFREVVGIKIPQQQDFALKMQRVGGVFVGHYGTVKPSNKRLIGDGSFVPCREVVISEVLFQTY